MPKPHIKFRIDFGPQEAVGPGKVALLEQIERSGSISRAARDLGMSYRRGWLLIESLNDSFWEPVTTAMKGGKGGGGATLTPFGREVVRAYRAFEKNVQELAVRHFTPLSRHSRKLGGGNKTAPIVRMHHR